jgi:hypothetical protein
MITNRPYHTIKHLIVIPHHIIIIISIIVTSIPHLIIHHHIMPMQQRHVQIQHAVVVVDVIDFDFGYVFNDARFL